MCGDKNKQLANGIILLNGIHIISAFVILLGADMLGANLMSYIDNLCR